MQETRQWEDPPGTELQAYDEAAAQQALGIPPGVDYYALLEVGRDADAATLKRQYYILARKWHPGGAAACIGPVMACGPGMHAHDDAISSQRVRLVRKCLRHLIMTCAMRCTSKAATTV